MSEHKWPPRRDFLFKALAGASLTMLGRQLSSGRTQDVKRIKQPRFGVNYTPSKHWWYSWLDWDQKSIAADLQAIAALGMDHIRIQCLWPIFQPNINYVSDTALQRLRALLDLADQAGLDVEVTVLDGWLSGFAFA